MEKERPNPLVRVADRPAEVHGAHPMNEASEMHYVSLGDLAGLSRVGVHLVRVPPGRESCVYHRHAAEEEWVYILQGHALADIDGESFEVGPGDFMGFPTPSVPHHLRNPYDEDLLFLVGGERRAVDIAEFPTLGKTLLRTPDGARVVETKALELFRIPED